MYRQAVDDSIRDWIGKGYIGSFYDAYAEGARKLFWDQLNEQLYAVGICRPAALQHSHLER